MRPISSQTPFRWPDLSRLPMAGLLCAFGLLAGVALAWAQADASKQPNRLVAEGSATPIGPAGTVQVGPLDPTARKDADRPVREGSEITDEVGTFKLTGDRAVFFSTDGHHRWCGLENLNLERIVRIVADTPEQLEWTVSGSITEYRGNNYLLVKRAIMRNHSLLRRDSATGTQNSAAPRQ